MVLKDDDTYLEGYVSASKGKIKKPLSSHTKNYSRVMNTMKRIMKRKYSKQVIITTNKHWVIHTLVFLYIKDM